MARALVKNASRPNTPNLLINGGFDYWQRNTTVAHTGTPSYGSVDRFLGENSGGGGTTTTRSTNVPSTVFQYSLQVTRSASAGSGSRFWQRIEASNIALYIGKQVTLSYWVSRDNLAIDLLQNLAYVPTGARDIWPAEVTGETNILSDVVTSQLPAVGNWVRISSTFTVPAGAANGLTVGVQANTSTAVTCSIFVAGMMLTEGPSAPANFYRAGPDMEAELSMCQRYFEKSYNVHVVPGTTGADGDTIHNDMANSTSSTNGIRVHFKVTKRTDLSTIVFYNRSTGVTGSWESVRSNAGAVTADGNVTMGSFGSTESSFGVSAASSIALATGDMVRMQGHWAANAEL